MKEFKKIVEAYMAVDFSKRKAALATVMQVKGSAYRRPGARMLITDDGRWTGAISGGCLEGDALRKAKTVMLENLPQLVTYDTMEDNSASSIAVGLGCNGVIDILIEPIDNTSNANPIEFLQDFLRSDEMAAMATIFSHTGTCNVKIGDKILYDRHGNTKSSAFDKEIYTDIASDLKKVWQKNRPATKTYTYESGQIEVLLEVLNPGVQLVIFGGGYDAAPLVRMSDQLGWEVIVTDDCIAHLGANRFPGACQVLMAPRNSISEVMKFKRNAAAVIMSHNFNYDYAVFKELIETDIPYIGIMGPKKRFDKMLEKLNSENIKIDDKWLHRIHSPIGLDIGAETPDEISVSVISEIQAYFNKKAAGFLKNLNGPIHDRSAYEDEFLNEMLVSDIPKSIISDH